MLSFLTTANRRDIANTFGITLTFTSTRSGLTRFQEHGTSVSGSGGMTSEERAQAEEAPEVTSRYYETSSDELPFREVHVRATDEDFYRRAVDFYRLNSSSFVYSVPIDVSASENVLVTASRAIFIGTNKQRAPAAVVGLQYQHKLFADRFFNHTEKCGSKDCRIKCRSETTECLLLDNHGFIIVSEDDSMTGRHVSEYDYELLQSLEAADILLLKKVLDHQAMCIESYQVSGFASYLSSPFHWIRNTVLWIWAKFTVLALDVYLHGLYDSLHSLVAGQETSTEGYESTTTSKDGIVIKYEGDIPIIKMMTKTKIRPCIREHDLYEVSQRWFTADSPTSSKYQKCPSFTSSCEP